MGKVIGAIAVILLGVGGYFGYQYYNETYKTTTAYAKVSTEVPEKVQSKDDQGRLVEKIYEYDYTVTFVKENGETTKRDFAVSGENPKPLTPGSYIKAEISNKRVNSPTTVAEVPSKIKDKVDSLNK